MQPPFAVVNPHQPIEQGKFTPLLQTRQVEDHLQPWPTTRGALRQNLLENYPTRRANQTTARPVIAIEKQELVGNSQQNLRQKWSCK